MSIGLPSPGRILDADDVISDCNQTPPSLSLSGILVVDEDPAFQLGFKTFLREYVGFEKVYTAANGREALDLIEADDSIELVTLDYQLPEMDGIEVLRELRSRCPRLISVMMVTGYPSDELEEEFYSFRSPNLLTNKFLSKPVEFEMLEPLMLAAYDELEKAKTKQDNPDEEEPRFFDNLPEPSTESHSDQRITQMEVIAANNKARLSELESQIESLKKSGKKKLWIGILAVAALWLASEFGAFKSVSPHWDNFKSTLVEAVTGEPSANPSPSPRAE